MSLTSMLDDRSGSLRCWFEERLPEVRFVQTAYRQAGPTTLLPPPECAHGTVGSAFDYRVRYYFAVTEPDTFVAAHGAMRADAGRLFGELATELSGFTQSAGPVGTRLDAKDEEKLNRLCFALALFEECFRGGPYPTSALVPLIARGSVKEFLAVPGERVVADLCAMSWAFIDSHHGLVARRDRTTLNPTFKGSGLVGGADADLIVDGCLYDLKASKQPGLKREAVYQLIGYALLDFDDEHGMTSVGFYRARVPASVTWDLADFVAESGGPSTTVAGLRSDLEPMLRAEIGARGATRLQGAR